MTEATCLHGHVAHTLHMPICRAYIPHSETGMSLQSLACLKNIIGSKQSDQAFNRLQTMQEKYLKSERYNSLALLKDCVELHCIERCRVVHTQITKEGQEKGLLVGSTLVDTYVKLGSLGEAQAVFDKLEAHDVVSWTALITGYANNGFHEETLGCLKKMQSDGVFPNETTYVCSLKGCNNVAGSEKGFKLHVEVVIDGYESQLFIGSTLVDMYAKCGLLAEAQEVFEELSVRNIVTWNALIMGYAKHQLGEIVLSIVVQMEASGVAPDAVTYVCGLKGCGCIQSLDKGQKVYAEITKKGLEAEYKVSSMVVDMFAKCGSCLEAVEVFNKIPVHDAVLWNTLLAGLVANGHDEKALDCLKQMNLEGVAVGIDTLVHSFKSCGSLRSLNDGRMIFTMAVKKGFDQELSVCNSLIDMYLKCGSLMEALIVFDKLQTRDAVSWTALIVGYTELGLGDKALSCFDKMQSEDVVLDAIALLCGLKACGITGNSSKGQELHAGIVEEGYEEDLLIGNALVDMYAKCGLLAEAQGVLEESPVQDVGSWNALLSGCIELGQFEEALKVLQEMQPMQIIPNLITCLCGLKCFAMGRDYGGGLGMHIEVLKKGYENDPFVGSAVIDMYSKLDSLPEAECVLDKLKLVELASWNAMIAGYVEHGLGKSALHCVKKLHLEGLCPDAITFMSGLKACVYSRELDSGREFHSEIAKKGMSSISHLDSSLVDMYVKCNSLVEARQVFDSMPVHDVVSWTALVTGYALHGFVEEAFECLKQMSVEGVYPNDVTYMSSMKACSSIRDRVWGQQIHSEIAKDGFERDPFVIATLVDTYAKCGLLVEARELLIDLQASERISSTALMAGYAEHGYRTESLSCLEQMEEAGVCINYVTYICSLKACGCTVAVMKGQELHAKIAKEGLESDPIINSGLTDMYAKCGCLREAQSVFEELTVHDLVSWNLLIAGYACQGESYVVFLLLDKMQKGGILPDKSTFLSVLFVCAHAGLVDQGHKLTECAIKVCGVSLTIEHFNCMIDLLTRAGQFFKAWVLMEKMPFQPELVTWSTMLCACQKWDNGVVTRQAFDYAARLGKKQVAAFQQIYRYSGSSHQFINPIA